MVGHLTTFILLAFFQTGLGFSMSTSMRHLVQRRDEENGAISTECIQMRNTAGEFQYISPGSNKVCALFLVSSPYDIIVIEFIDFDVTCDFGGLLAVVDGWVNGNSLFPPESDQAADGTGDRYRTFCGTDASQPKRFLFSQNAAMVQFRIPLEGQGFRIRIDFQKNPAPCNAVLARSDGVLTIDNRGRHGNCSVLMAYPEEIRIIQMDVEGGTGPLFGRPYRKKTTPSFAHCKNRRDYVEVRGGNDFGENSMHTFLTVCRASSRPGYYYRSSFGQLRPVTIQCPYTMVRLVSTGQFYNSVTFRYAATGDDNPDVEEVGDPLAEAAPPPPSAPRSSSEVFACVADDLSE